MQIYLMASQDQYINMCAARFRKVFRKVVRVISTLAEPAGYSFAIRAAQPTAWTGNVFAGEGCVLRTACVRDTPLATTTLAERASFCHAGSRADQ